MPSTPESTVRLVIREWHEGDSADFAAMNSDPVVMATIGPVMTRVESDQMLQRIDAHLDRWGFGLWCLELDEVAIGFCGLMVPWFMDGVEIGWRLRSEFWGHGYATEAAMSVLRFGFDSVGLDEVISFTAATNERSRRVMGRIGLQHDPASDFDHPALAEDNPLRPHVLYRMDSARYRAGL